MSELTRLAPFSEAEQKLIDEAALPDRTRVGDGELPKAGDNASKVRAALIRALLLETGNGALHSKGLRLRGACVTGALDLQGSEVAHDVTLSQCRLTDPINVINARLRGLHLSGCEMAGISGDNADFSGSVYLRSGTVMRGEISLAGARIKGDLQICDARLEADGQDAIFAPSLRVGGSMFLGNYPYSEGISTLESVGALFFSSARIEHDLFLTNTAISLPEGALLSAVFRASEEHGGDMALSLARVHVGGILYLQDNQIARGIVNLAGADVARLKDEPIAPGASYPIRLDGFRYSDFSRHADIGISARLDWLARRPPDTPFVAQPYEQLAYVLTRLGHRSDAQTVLMKKEELLRAENRRLDTVRNVSPIWRGMAYIGDMILRWTIGYGYRPGRAVVVAVLLIAGLGVFFTQTWRAGDMTPNAAPILVSGDWISATESHPENPAAFWAQPDQAGKDWETFNGFAYAADLVIPIVSLGQESAWAPSTSRSDWGRAGWWIRWFAKGIGWLVTALGAAAITGVIRKD